MKLICKLIDQTPDTTISTLHLEDKYIGIVMEDGHRDTKVPGLTRIPAGIYSLLRRTNGRFYNKYSSRYNHKHVFELQDVPGFVGIIPHIGNFATDTRGCPLICSGFRLAKEYQGLNSTPAYLKFYELITPIIEETDILWEVIR